MGHQQESRGQKGMGGQTRVGASRPPTSFLFSHSSCTFSFIFNILSLFGPPTFCQSPPLFGLEFLVSFPAFFLPPTPFQPPTLFRLLLSCHPLSSLFWQLPIWQLPIWLAQNSLLGYQESFSWELARCSVMQQRSMQRALQGCYVSPLLNLSLKSISNPQVVQLSVALQGTLD